MTPVEETYDVDLTLYDMYSWREVGLYEEFIASYLVLLDINIQTIEYYAEHPPVNWWVINNVVTELTTLMYIVAEFEDFETAGQIKTELTEAIQQICADFDFDTIKWQAKELFD